MVMVSLHSSKTPTRTESNTVSEIMSYHVILAILDMEKHLCQHAGLCRVSKYWCVLLCNTKSSIDITLALLGKSIGISLPGFG